MPQRYSRRKIRAPEPPQEMPDETKIEALESELRLLSPYATTKDLPKLKRRVEVLRSAIAKLRGLPLDEAPGRAVPRSDLRRMGRV